MMDSFELQHPACAFTQSERRFAETVGEDAVFAEGLCVPIGTLSAVDPILEHRPPIPCPLDQPLTGSVRLPFRFYGATLTFQSTPLTRRMCIPLKEEIMT